MKNFNITVTVSSDIDCNHEELSEYLDNYFNHLLDDINYIGIKITDLDKSNGDI